jgi:hypothetical protein
MLARHVVVPGHCPGGPAPSQRTAALSEGQFASFSQVTLVMRLSSAPAVFPQQTLPGCPSAEQSVASSQGMASWLLLLQFVPVVRHV